MVGVREVQEVQEVQDRQRQLFERICECHVISGKAHRTSEQRNSTQRSRIASSASYRSVPSLLVPPSSAPTELPCGLSTAMLFQ